MPATVIDTLAQRVGRTPGATAFNVLLPNSSWRPVTWAAFGTRVDAVAAAFAAAGLGPGDRVAICANTSLDWEVAQMAAFRIGASVVGLDPAYGNDLLAQLIDRLAIRALVAQDATTVQRFPDLMLSTLRLVLTIVPSVSGVPPIPSMDALVAANAKTRTATAARNPDDEAIVVFSSGTTGTPKPVFYCHGQVVLAVDAILDAFSDIREGSTLVCWLPLANLFQRMINFAAIARGASTYIVEDPRMVTEHIASAGPDVFIGVPRFFEKLYAGICDRIDALPPVQAALVRAAIRVGVRKADALRAGPPLALFERVAWRLIHRRVLRKLRVPFGPNLRYFISGSAAMPDWLLRWFDGIGLPVLEAYGVSENIVPVAANRFDQRKSGTVGKPLPGQAVRVADDGEICVCGPGVALRGQSEHVIDYSSWREARTLPTGDLGEFDTDGFLRVTGRKSEVFKTSAGRWIAPTVIEGRLRRIPHIEHAIITGTARKAVIALVWVAASLLDELVAAIDSTAAAPGGEGSVDAVSKLRGEVAATLSGLPDYQHPVGVLVFPAEQFSVAGGDLTTNLKVRRRHIEDKYANAIDRMFDEIDRAVTARSVSPVVVVAHTAEAALTSDSSAPSV